MIIGVIGSGKIGGTLARLAVGAGHDVILSNTRGPESLRDLVAELGPRARAVTPGEAAEGGDVVVVTIPFGAHPQIPNQPLRGKVVIDATNYNPTRDGGYPNIDAGVSSTGEVMQGHLKDARVVKAFNNIFFKHLATLGRPAGAPDRSALPIAGDDSTAKAEVSALLDSLGYDALDAGPMSENRRWAFGTPGNNAYLDPEGMFAAPGRPASADAVAKLLEAMPPASHGATDEECKLVESLYSVFSTREFGLLDVVLAPTWEDMPMAPGQQPGSEGLKTVIEHFHQSFENGRVVLHDIVGGSGMVAVRGELRGVHRGEFLGVKGTGKPGVITIHEFHRIEDGRIARSWHLEDLFGWVQQMTK
jgi:predicted dinucleotide-binding enzyme/predicted ester cyclase